MINVGFIGLGGMGRLQLRSFAQVDGCRIVAGADPTPGARQAFSDDFPDATVYEDHAAMLRDDRVEAVVVAVPTGMHPGVGQAVLETRRPLLLEKPMARTVAQCRTLIDTAAKHDTLLMVAQCRRFDPAWGTWGEMVRGGKLGTPVLWRHAMAGPGPERGWFMDDAMGGGPLLDGAVHNYDFANFLWGDPLTVTAQAIKLNPRATAVDTGTAIIAYPGGHQLMVSWSWGTRGGHLFDLLGPRASLQAGPGEFAVSEEDRREHEFLRLCNGAADPELVKTPKDGPLKYDRQAEHFLACAAGKAACASPGDEAIKAVAVAEAIFASASDGGRPTQVCW